MIRQFYLFFFLLGLLCTSTLAQTTLEGKIISDGEPVPFANVFIQKSKRGATTDANGHYSIPNLPQGKYTVIASSLGFISDKKEVSMST